MDVKFGDSNLERLAADAKYTGDHPADIIRDFRKRLNFIRQAEDERDLQAFKSLRFEKLDSADGNRYHLPLSDGLSLMIELEDRKPAKKLTIIAIEDCR